VLSHQPKYVPAQWLLVTTQSAKKIPTAHSPIPTAHCVKKHTILGPDVSKFYKDNGIHKLYTVKRFCNGLDETLRAFAVRLFTRAN